MQGCVSDKASAELHYLLFQVATNSAQAAERDACETEDADKLKNVALATYKASQASVRSLEAAEAAAEAEKLAMEAANLASKAGTALALNNALATAQAFNGVIIIETSQYLDHLQVGFLF